MTAKPTAAALGTVPFALPTMSLQQQQQQQQQMQQQRQQLEEAAAAADGKKAPAFVRRLWEALSDHANSPIITWNSDSSFTIRLFKFIKILLFNIILIKTTQWIRASFRQRCFQRCSSLRTTRSSCDN